MTTVESILTAALAGMALLASGWRGIRAVHQFISAVETNTAAVADLAAELHAHTTQTADALAGLDRRVTTLEGQPHA